jgi:hypothetical protein
MLNRINTATTIRIHNMIKGCYSTGYVPKTLSHNGELTPKR